MKNYREDTHHTIPCAPAPFGTKELYLSGTTNTVSPSVSLNTWRLKIILKITIYYTKKKLKFTTVKSNYSAIKKNTLKIHAEVSQNIESGI